MIDGSTQDFLRAETATIASVFPTVILMRSDFVVNGASGNAVILATDTELDAFVGDAQVLTDDYAPVDQLLTPYG